MKLSKNLNQNLTPDAWIKKGYTPKEFDRLRTEPFDKKLERSLDLVEWTLKRFPGKSMVAWSGGKDSTVVLDLALTFDRDVLVVFHNTTNEYPETLKYVRGLAKEWHLNFIETKPKKTFWQCMNEYGFPKMRWHRHPERNTRLGGIPRCCYWLKHEPAARIIKEKGIRAVLRGLTIEESWTRRMSIMTRSMLKVIKTNVPYQIIYCDPIAFWRTDEVFDYFEKNEIPLNPAYEFTDRLGCRVCTSYRGWEQNLIRYNPSLYNLVMNKMKEQGDKRAKTLVTTLRCS